MKHFFFILALSLAAVALLAGCNKGSQRDGYVVDGFAFQAEENGLWGLMDTDGKVLVKPQFDNPPTDPIGGMFAVAEYEEGARTKYSIYAVGAEPRKIGTYVDAGNYTSRFCPVVDENMTVRYIDKEGKTAIDLKPVGGKSVVSAFNFFCGRAMVMLEDHKWGYIDETGKTVVPFKYADAWNFAEGLAIVFLDDPNENPDAKWAVIDTEGKELFTKAFSKMQPAFFRFFDGYLTCNDADERYYIVDRQGEVVSRVKRGHVAGTVGGGKFTIYDTDSEQYGLTDLNGETVMKTKFDAMNFNGRLLVAATGERFTLYTPDGEKVTKLPRGYAHVFDLEYKNYADRLLVGQYDEGYRLLDGKGNPISTGAKIFSFSTSYFWGASVPGFFEDEEEGDFVEDWVEGDEDDIEAADEWEPVDEEI